MKFVYTNLSGDSELRPQLKQLRDVRVGIREAGGGGERGRGRGREHFEDKTSQRSVVPIFERNGY